MSFSDRVAGWRNSLISNPDFQSWAARNPFTRSIAKRRAREAFDLVAGFVYSQVLAASIESGLLEMAGQAPIHGETFASRAALPQDAAFRLLRAATALDLLRLRKDGQFMLGGKGAALLANPSVFAMVRHHSAFYRDIQSPLEMLRIRDRATELCRFWAYDPTADESEAAPYSELMAATQALIARNILEAYNFRRHRTLMDIGGGLGAFLVAVSTAHPKLDLILVDLPSVARLARERVSDVIRIEARDMLREPLPPGADLISLVRVLHDHNDEPARVLLSSIRRALAPGGRLLIAEPMAGIRGTEPMSDAYFGMYLWAMGRGNPRSPAEIAHLLNTVKLR